MLSLCFQLLKTFLTLNSPCCYLRQTEFLQGFLVVCFEITAKTVHSLLKTRLGKIFFHI